MLTIRRAADRGHARYDWLDTYHTFSFGEYQDPRHEQFSCLRVMNEDVVAPGLGFGMHGHRDMEILTCVLSGTLQHRDSLGNGGVLQPGEWQWMSAGKGIRHSEFNPSPTEPVHLYQIWLLPERAGEVPAYDQREFPAAARQGHWQLVAAPAADPDVLPIRQDARVLQAAVLPGQELSYAFPSRRQGWLQVIRGSVRAPDLQLHVSDGLAIRDEPKLELTSESGADVLLFDLP